jgi:hypothetical protein
MTPLTTMEFIGLHVANLLLGLFTLGAVAAICWAMAVDILHAHRSHAR